MKNASRFFIRIDGDTELSAALQKILFSRGFAWNGRKAGEVWHPPLHAMDEYKYLVMVNVHTLKTIMWGEFVDRPDDKELTLAEFLTEKYTELAPIEIVLNKEYKAEVKDKGIQVGCQFIPQENLQILFDKLKESSIVK